MSWSRNSGDFELVTSHGFTQHQLILWKLGSMFPSYLEPLISKFGFPLKENEIGTKEARKIKKFIPLMSFNGHTERVIHMARDPNNNEVIVTGSADATLRFWNVFYKTKTSKIPILPTRS